MKDLHPYLPILERKRINWDIQSVSYIQESMSLKEHSIPKNLSYLNYENLRTQIALLYSVFYKKKNVNSCSGYGDFAHIYNRILRASCNSKVNCYDTVLSEES